MNRYFLFSISIIITLSFAFQSSELSKTKSALLWEVKSKDGKNTSYLFGTFHVIQKEYFLFNKTLSSKIINSDTIIMELEKLPTPEESTSLFKLSKGSFFDYFSPTQNDSIIRWVNDNLHMESQVFRLYFHQMKPFVFNQLIIQKMFEGKTESYELKLFEIAKEKGIPILGLETLEFQLSFFDRLTNEEQNEMVMSNIRNYVSLKQELVSFQQVYYSQNIDSVYQLIQQDKQFRVKHEDEFITKRNKNWIPLIENYINKSDCFIAVGAGHLGGENGIINLLEKKGYTLTPIRI